MEKYPQYPYKKARLVNADKALSVRWYIEFWVWDKQHEKLIRKRDYQVNQEKTVPSRKSFASKRIKELNAILEKGVFVDNSVQEKLDVTSPQSQNISVLEALDYALKIKKAEGRKSTYQNYLSIYKMAVHHFTEQKQEKQPINSIKKQHIIFFIDSIITSRGIGNQTRNNYLNKLSSLFQMLHDRGMMTDNPCKGIPKLRTEIGRNIAFTKAQAQELKALIEPINAQLWLFIQFMYYGFIRPNEIRQLQVKHIDLVNNKIMVPAAIAKNKKTAFVRIAPPFAEHLAAMELHRFSGDDYLFSPNGSCGNWMLPENEMTSKHLKLLRSIKFPPEYTLYSWKHTGVVHHYLARVDIKSLQAQLRHSNLQETDTYLKSLGLFENKEIENKAPIL